MIQLVQVFLLGLTLGGVYALMASGLTLIFGVMRIVNIAHGAFILFAAYLAYWGFKLYQIDPMFSLLFTMPVMFLLGMGIYRLLFPRIAGSRRFTSMTVLLTFSLALIMEGVMGFLYSGIYRSANPPYTTRALLFGPFYLPLAQLYATLLSLVLLGLLFLFLRFTRTGRAIRATMQNRTAAQIVGVNVEQISTLAFGIGTALAGASGSMVSFLFTFFPAKHWQWIGTLLALIVLGGMGSLPGSVVGSFLLAVIAAYLGYFYGPTWSPITFYLALFLILLIRPEGLLGKKLEA
ncbi:MAG: branched-chain amino acid ABC transporter permease [Armatimonadota bacterium]|nr:branched-chain amino acid ABC transporter permease [Armatimonadota bacterium]MDR5702911.1 branched-chain amino acid ABC transporter permease [Armatimonadota bacterium]MDR7435026.1 branched-chain amino acid ABC transporter permease [Armatimonadota bacterium]